MTPRLTVVGTGLHVGQITTEARTAIRSADAVLHLVADPITRAWLEREAPDGESLMDCYRPGEHRRAAYDRMVERILARARAGGHVVVAFYGHPGVFVDPGHRAVARARAEGIEARMQPGVSALDCLVSDLGVDPGSRGLQTYEATDFLERRPTVDAGRDLVLWQPGTLGVRGYRDEPDPDALEELARLLAELYGERAEAVLYEAATLPLARHREDRIRVAELPEARLTAATTMYVEARKG